MLRSAVVVEECLDIYAECSCSPSGILQRKEVSLWIRKIATLWQEDARRCS